MGQLHFSIAGSVPRERSRRDDPERAAKALAVLLIVSLFLLPQRQPEATGSGDTAAAGAAAPNDTDPVANAGDSVAPQPAAESPGQPQSTADSAAGAAAQSRAAGESHEEPPAEPPPPVKLSISPNPAEFHGQPVGVPRGDYPITIYNRGQRKITLKYGDEASSGDFHLEGKCDGKTVEPAESCPDIASFAPQASGERAGSRNILVDGAVVGAIAFTGQGTTISIGLPDRVVFEGSATSQPLVVRNTGTADLQIRRTSISTARPFDRPPQSCVSQYVAPQAQCTINVTIKDGPRPVAQEATFTIEDNAPGSPHRVALRAEVYAAVLSADPPRVDFGSVPAGELRDVPIAIVNTGEAPMGALRAYVSDAGFRVAANDCNTSSAQNDRCVITVRFSPPAAATNYDGNLMVTSPSGGASVSIALHGSGAASTGHDPTRN